MTNQDLERPKELYFEYSGSKYQMMRDGVIDEYRQYAVTDGQEKAWLTELIEKELKQLDINNKETLFPLWYILQTHCISSYVDKIIDFIDKNKDKAEDAAKLLSFIGKTSEVIDRIDENCKSSMMLTGRCKRRIEVMKSKYFG